MRLSTNTGSRVRCLTFFDKDYKRKWAYKGFCDGIAGEDLGLKYGGEEYKAFYEKNNVSSAVDK